MARDEIRKRIWKRINKRGNGRRQDSITSGYTNKSRKGFLTG